MPRVKILLRGKGVLPISYNYYLGSFVIRTIERVDEELAARLHAASPFKPYTFSRLLGRAIEKNGYLRFNSRKIVWYFSSICSDVVKSLLKGLLSRREHKIQGFRFSVEGFEYVDFPGGEVLDFNSLSPVAVSIKQDGKKVFLDPSQEKFLEELLLNAKRKAEHFLGENEVSLSVAIEKARPHLLTVKGSRILSFDLEGTLEGEKDVIELLWNVGLGEKNGLGFGMVGLRRGRSL